MIELHRLKGKSFYLNHKLIETIESGADTIVVLSSDRKYVVEESSEEIVELIHEFEHQNSEIQINKIDDKEN